MSYVQNQKGQQYKIIIGILKFAFACPLTNYGPESAFSIMHYILSDRRSNMGPRKLAATLLSSINKDFVYEETSKPPKQLKIEDLLTHKSSTLLPIKKKLRTNNSAKNDEVQPVTETLKNNSNDASHLKKKKTMN